MNGSHRDDERKATQGSHGHLHGSRLASSFTEEPKGVSNAQQALSGVARLGLRGVMPTSTSVAEPFGKKPCGNGRVEAPRRNGPFDVGLYTGCGYGADAARLSLRGLGRSLRAR
jgi:hypothetical protein